MSFSIELQKEDFKFSCSHFTIFGPDRAERLHGHNYYVQVYLKIHPTKGDMGLQPDVGLAFEFNSIKSMIRALCESLDEYVLIPSQSPYLKMTEDGHNISFRFHHKTYSLPREDVKTLPLTNITSEELARYLTHLLCDQIVQGGKLNHLSEISVAVEETRGQRVVFSVVV